LLTGNILVTKLPVYCHMFKDQQRDIAKEQYFITVLSWQLYTGHHIC